MASSTGRRSSTLGLAAAAGSWWLRAGGGVPGSRAWSEGLSSPGIQQQQLSVHIRVSIIKYIAAAVTAAEKLLVNGSETLKGDVKRKLYYFIGFNLI